MSDPAWADAVGFVAGTLTTLAFLPQVLKTWRTRSARDLSLAMLLSFCAGVVLWLVYGVMIGQWPIILPNIVTLVLAGSILVFKLRESPPDGGDRESRRSP
ncbi:MAG: SemiSWEET transporter [Alphaproteobacteria bacterium]|nr:SemiSWEET transporter [Alphaproteobacteria bacterium]